MSAPRAEVLAVGDEMLHGRAIDTNSAHIAARLGELGCAVARFQLVGDEPGELARTIGDATTRARLVVATGGLGPTEDDRTRHAAAAVAGVELRFDDRSWGWIEEWFRSRGRKLGDDNRRQALLPAGADALSNQWGTAPGFAMTIGDCRLFVLPGVPREMKEMFEAHVAPAVAAMFAADLQPVVHRTLRVLGLPEARLGARLADLMAVTDSDLQVGITAHAGLLSVRLVARDRDRAAAERTVEAAVAEILPRLGADLFYAGDDTPAERIVTTLRLHGATLATAESCTGGLVAKLLTDVPGSSLVYPGGFVTYSNERKIADLGIDPALLAEHGAVSEPVAAGMAEGARHRTGASIGLAVTGIAGPEGGTESKPVGTVCFGLADAVGTAVWTRRIAPVSRDFVRECSAYEAFRAVLRRLSG